MTQVALNHPPNPMNQAFTDRTCYHIIGHCVKDFGKPTQQWLNAAGTGWVNDDRSAVWCGTKAQLNRMRSRSDFATKGVRNRWVRKTDESRSVRFF